jgi:hypothetical protein
MPRRLTIRAAALSIACLVATSAIVQARPAASATSPTAAPAASRALSASGSNERAHRRGTVDARTLSRQAHVARPSATVPSKLRSAAARPHAKLGPAVEVAGGPAPTPATLTSMNPINKTPFDGVARSTDAVDIEPPDPWVAAGPDHVVQVVNLTMRITDRQGVISQPDVPLPAFFQLPDETFDSDPHVIFDALHGRWFATELSWDCLASDTATFGHGYVDFAASRTADPTGIWDIYFLTYDDTLPDFPAPGTSSDKFGIASNFFTMTSGAGAGGLDCLDNLNFSRGHVSIMDTSDLLSGALSSITGDDYGPTPAHPGTPQEFTPRIATQVPATSPRMHIVTLSATNSVVYRSLVGSSVAHTLHYERTPDDLDAEGLIGPAVDPPPPQQPGPATVTAAIDGRPTDLIWQNNRLVMVSSYGCTPATDTVMHDCVRVTELRTNGVPGTGPTKKQDFVIAEVDRDHYMGGVGLAGNGILDVVWSRSSTTAGDFPSSITAYQLPTDAVNTLRGQATIKPGTGVYTGDRWGDYVGVAQDPIVPSAVWQANEYSGGGTEWKTFVSRLQPGGTTYFPITPVRVLDTRGGKGLSGPFVAGTPRTWQVTGGASGIPSNAVAVTGNVTVTGQTQAGYVAVTPTPVNPPPSSTINFPAGDTRANNVTVTLSPTGSLSAVYRAGGGQKTNLIFDVTGYFLANTTGATFKTITPLRILDTRDLTGDHGLAGKFVNGTARQLQVTGVGGLAGVPAGATAITGNLTVTKQSAAGYLSVSPGMPPTNPATSNLNFPVSDNRANGFFARLDGAGKLWIVYKSGATGATTDVLLDVTGYFVPDLTGLKFVPLNPARVMDTRSGVVLSGLSGQFAATLPRTLEVDGHWGVPIGAAAISGNLTVTGQTAGGFVSVSPAAPPPVPDTSTINFPLGDNRANGMVTPVADVGLDQDGTYLVYIGATGKKTDLILDLSGYFEP